MSSLVASSRALASAAALSGRLSRRRGGASIPARTRRWRRHPVRLLAWDCSTWLTCGFAASWVGRGTCSGLLRLSAPHPRTSATPSTRTSGEGGRSARWSSGQQQERIRGREMRRNKIKNSGGAGAIRRWRSGAVVALMVGMAGGSIAGAASGDDGPDQVRSFRSKFIHVTGMSVAASVAVEAAHRPHVSNSERSIAGRGAERSDVIA